MNKPIVIIFLVVVCLCYMGSLKAQNTPGENFDLSAWKLQTLEESDSSYAQVYPINTHSSSFFYTNSSDDAMVFRVPSNGGTTSVNTSYPRVELRQMTAGANWPLSDVTEHYLTAQCRVMEICEEKPKTIIGQIHGHENNSELLKIRWTGDQPGECFVEARFQTNDNDGSEYGEVLASALSLGDTINYTVTMTQGVVNVTVNGNSASQTYTSQYYGTTDTYYFKAGNYIQWNEDIVGPTTVSGESLFYKISLEKEIITSTAEENKINPFILYPNPVKDFLNLETTFKIEEITVSNIEGRFFDVKLVNQNLIDISHLYSGIYLIEVISDEMNLTYKIIKE